jgi:hypothetical protein
MARAQDFVVPAPQTEALASYARQMNDTALREIADRIQARAIRHAGELLLQIPPATGAYLKKAGAGPLSRKDAARDAGLSGRQSKTSAGDRDGVR